MYPPYTCLILFLTINIFGDITVNCATYENVTINLSTRSTILFINDEPPVKNVTIRSDYTLVEYVNNQPLETLQIENQTIPKLTKNSVADLPNITDISIISCGIREIEPGTFRNLPALEYLYINGNPLEEIKDGVFTNLTIDSLNIDNNKISKLGNKAFNNMGMRHLFIRHNQISVWKSDWFLGTPLESVDMGYNLVEEIPANAFEYYVKFKNDYNDLSIWYIILNDNKLTKINPDAFRGIDELLYINVSNNAIEQLPPGVFGTVKYINNFDFSNNKIAAIDVQAVFNNTKLTYVKLQNNLLNCFPLEIVNITEIYRLNLDGNPVTCECVEIWHNWQTQNKTNILVLENIQKNCIK